MDNEQNISKALQLKGRMRAIVTQGYALMSDMQDTDEVVQGTLAQVWEPAALQEMPTSLAIIIQALQDIQAQCPNLAAVIFPQQEEI